jgi:hypothetical protein
VGALSAWRRYGVTRAPGIKILRLGAGKTAPRIMVAHPSVSRLGVRLGEGVQARGHDEVLVAILEALHLDPDFFDPPENSCPSTEGSSGLIPNQVKSPIHTCQSERQTPSASTRTIAPLDGHAGSGISRTGIGALNPSSNIAFIRYLDSCSSNSGCAPRGPFANRPYGTSLMINLKARIISCGHS